MIRNVLGLDIGSNSVGSSWIDRKTGEIVTGISIFPAGVEESDDKRGDPKNVKRRMARRARLTLARRSQRKRLLRLRLIEAGLLPSTEREFRRLLDDTDPWDLRVRGLDQPLTPYEFGRVLLHLSQRRGALGLNLRPIDDAEDTEDAGAADQDEEGKVKAAIQEVRARMKETGAPTFGAFIAAVRAERIVPIVTEDRRRPDRRKGPREYRKAVRNRAGSYEHCADRSMIREEFALLWDAQRGMSPGLRVTLTDDLRHALDDESGDGQWIHKGLLFGQRRASWDAGTLGRCDLHPTDRCVPHADRHASRYRVVETVNNLRVQERGMRERPLTPEERARIIEYLSAPLGMYTPPKRKGQPQEPRPKTTVVVTDLRNLMGWGRASKTAQFRFNIESDSDRSINTDWFSREIVHGAVTVERWNELTERQRENLNRLLLRFDPENPDHAGRLKVATQKSAGLTDEQADRFVAAWIRRPKLEKRLNMSRRAVRNVLRIMDRDEPWPDGSSPDSYRWLTQIEARKRIAEDADFVDTSGLPLDHRTRERYHTGARGSTKKDRQYMRKHLLREAGELILDSDGKPLSEPPPAPMISNPVVRRSIHEVRRHLIAHLRRAKGKPDAVVVELSREARMGKDRADKVLALNRLRNRIRNEIIEAFGLSTRSTTQQRAAVKRVILAVHQDRRCPLCGEGGLTERMAATGEGCEIAHIIPRAVGGHNGFSNIVLSHTQCNRDMARRTPREFWMDGVGFERGIGRVETIYSNIERVPRSQQRSTSGPELWRCYFDKRDDQRKVGQFKKDVADIQEMTARQSAATTYATRQIMAYLANALFDEGGLPERGGMDGPESSTRRVFATDGMWTSRLRYEWGMIIDPHKDGSVDEDESAERKEKNRGDHRHHAIDAIVIALTDRKIQLQWDERDKQADRAGVNTGDEEQLKRWYRNNPLPPPSPFTDWSRARFREEVGRAVFGDGGEKGLSRPVSHRPVKRKLIGALHEETLFGPVLDASGKPTGDYTGRKQVEALNSNHLRLPQPEAVAQAIERLSARRVRRSGMSSSEARTWAQEFVSRSGYTPQDVDPAPGKSGLVRDLAVRRRIRECLEEAGLNPDKFTASEIRRLALSGEIRHRSGVPIRSVVLLRTMNDPVIVARKKQDYRTGRLVEDPAARAPRAYVGGNNHHIEIRVDDRGRWSGTVVSTFESSRRNTTRLRAFREAGIPSSAGLRRLSAAERRPFRERIAQIEREHAIVDRSDDPEKGRFVMSLSEGEMVLMRHPKRDEVDHFVVTKLDKPNVIGLTAHWDARAATGRKDEEGRKVSGSERETIYIRPSKFGELAPSEEVPHLLKVRVDPLGNVVVLTKD